MMKVKTEYMTITNENGKGVLVEYNALTNTAHITVMKKAGEVITMEISNVEEMQTIAKQMSAIARRMKTPIVLH